MLTNKNTRVEDIINGLNEHGKVTVRGFGSFTVVERKARSGRNATTGERIEIPARMAVKFRPSKALRAMVND